MYVNERNILPPIVRLQGHIFKSSAAFGASAVDEQVTPVLNVAIASSARAHENCHIVSGFCGSEQCGGSARLITIEENIA